MTEIYSLVLIILSLSLGAVLGYFTRQSLAKRNAKTIEAKIQRMIEKAKEEADLILKEAERKKREGEREILKKESLLSKKEYLLRKKVSEIEKKEI
jgi:uncharacterized protein HemX